MVRKSTARKKKTQKRKKQPIRKISKESQRIYNILTKIGKEMDQLEKKNIKPKVFGKNLNLLDEKKKKRGKKKRIRAGAVTPVPRGATQNKGVGAVAATAIKAAPTASTDPNSCSAIQTRYDRSASSATTLAACTGCDNNHDNKGSPCEDQGQDIKLTPTEKDNGKCWDGCTGKKGPGSARDVDGGDTLQCRAALQPCTMGERAKDYIWQQFVSRGTAAGTAVTSHLAHGAIDKAGDKADEQIRAGLGKDKKDKSKDDKSKDDKSKDDKSKDDKSKSAAPAKTSAKAPAKTPAAAAPATTQAAAPAATTQAAAPAATTQAAAPATTQAAAPAATTQAAAPAAPPRAAAPQLSANERREKRRKARLARRRSARAAASTRPNR